MKNSPQFKPDPDHIFTENEEVLIIDKNKLDLWKGIITKIEGNQISIHYPDYPDYDEDLTGFSRILPANRENTRIFNNQEAKRAEILPSLSGSEEEPFSNSDGDDDTSGRYQPVKSPKKVKKAKKPKKEKPEKPIKPRPEGCRHSPRFSQ